METKYKEIIRLKEMLEQAKIPFHFSELFGGFHICYPKAGRFCKCSVIEHNGSYGRTRDSLEIMGLMTKKEIKETKDTVLGYLTAENVFQRIKRHYFKECKKK